MNLFQSTGQGQQSFPNSQMSFGQFNRQNSLGMQNPFQTSSLTGPNSLFPQSGANNLFSNNSNTGQMWGGQQSATPNNQLFSRSNTMPSNLFGPQQNTGGTGGAANMFQTNNNNIANPFQRSNTMMNSGSSPSFLTNNSSTQNNLFSSGGGHGYNTRSGLGSLATDKEELRMEDYALMKAGQVPDSIQMAIRKNIQGLDNPSPMNMGGTGNGVMIGSSGNNLFQNQSSGGNMGMGNNTMGMTGNNPTTANLFANNSLQRPTWPNSTPNNLFQSNNQTGGMGSFPMGQQGNTGPGFSGNNLFATGNNQNFTNQQQPGSFFNQPNNQLNSNPFNQNRFQTQSSGFPQNNMNQQGANLFTNSTNSTGSNLFQNNKPTLSFMSSSGPTPNNSLFPFKPNQPSLFPNQTQPPNSLFPQQGQNQLGFMSSNPNNPQMPNMGTQNPHLFPNQGAMPMGYPGFPQPGYPYPGFYPQGYQGYPGFPQDMSQNPHLFPQYGQMPYQPPSLQTYMAMQQGYEPSLYEKLQQAEDEKKTYTPRQTLNEAVADLSSKISEETVTSTHRSFTYFPYNPFEKKINKKNDAADREALRNLSMLRPAQVNKSIIRREEDEDAFRLIKKSKYVEDDVEIIMKPKFFLQPTNRNRSSSPVSNRSVERGSTKTIYDNTIKVSVNVNIGTLVTKTNKVKIYRKTNIMGLKIKVLEELRDERLLRPESTISLEDLAARCELFFENRIVHNGRNLDQVGILDGSSVLLQIDEEHASEEVVEENRRKRQQMEEDNMNSLLGRGSERSYQVSRHVPKLTRNGYYTKPSMEDLYRMSDTELMVVEGFTVGNDHGKIEFEGKTDVRDVDLDEVILIEQRSAEVYPQAKFPTEGSKPIRGEKLNKPAMITLYKCLPKGTTIEMIKNMNLEDLKKKEAELKKKYEEQAHKMGNEFVDYDIVNLVYRIRVRHF